MFAARTRRPASYGDRLGHLVNCFGDGRAEEVAGWLDVLGFDAVDLGSLAETVP
ncbi:hypothetical protein ACIO8H_28490 [Streptomyces sp. NPDC087226]|uniref:hypothetical protein n=1 Tax=Streptomyces sp. NPDC087226 TaxID=3365771 RepID=UPI003813C2A4